MAMTLTLTSKSARLLLAGLACLSLAAPQAAFARHVRAQHAAVHADVAVAVLRDGTRVTVRLPRANMRYTLSDQPWGLRLDLPGVGAVRPPAAGADTGLVKSVDVRRLAGHARIDLRLRGAAEHAVTQVGRDLLIDLHAAPGAPTRPAAPAPATGGYAGHRLSLNFQSVEVRNVLQVLADFTGLNIVASDSVTGSLTLRLKNVPWDQALDIILQARGLEMRRSGNVIWVATHEELANREKQMLESKQQVASLEPLATETFRLNYGKAEDFQKVLSNDKQRILSPRGSVVMEPHTNSLIVRDTPESLKEVRKLLDSIDIPARQVSIEARIVEATDSFAKNLGARLMLTGTNLRGGNTYTSYSGSLAGTPERNSLDGAPQSLAYLPQNLAVNMAAAGINGINPGSLAVQVFKSSAGALGLELSALEADGKGKVLSNPRLITADQVEASIEQGTEIPYQMNTSSGATAVDFKKAVLSLKVKPQITPDNKIILDVTVHKDSAGVATTAGPAIDTKQMTTRVLVNDGDTVVIGGIYTKDEQNTVTKVPLLGDLPVIGAAFRNKNNSTAKSELLIFITPKLLADLKTQARAGGDATLTVDTAR